MPPIDVSLQVTLAVRLLLAAVLGAAIGLERELRGHAAGTRTQLLVSVGSAAFTMLSIYGFVDLGEGAATGSPDPSRVAAQIVTGIGFLGAGAIIKYGTSVRGMTTAASLWVAAAVGMAAGTGQWVLAIVTAAIVVFTLGPLQWIVLRATGRRRRVVHVRLEVSRIGAIGDISKTLADRGVPLVGINSERIEQGRYEVDLALHLPAGGRAADLLRSIDDLPDVEVLETTSDPE
jgi:putative Mg2+ transporter-C (MgtC) family protein